MVRREELIRSIITGQSNESQPNVNQALLNTDVVQLALDAQREKLLIEPDFGVLSIDRKYREENTPVFEITTGKEFSLANMLKHFIDFTNTMKLSDKTIMREYGDIFEAKKFECEALYSYQLEPDQREVTDEKIVILGADHHDYGGYTFDSPILYHAKKNQQTITIEPADESIGKYTSTQVLEAYILYLLSEK